MSRHSFYCLAAGLSLTLGASMAEAAPAMHRFGPGPTVKAPAMRPSPDRPRVHRPLRPIVNTGLGPLLPLYWQPQTVFLGSEDGSATRTVNLNINRVPVVLGIRRPPEAAPVIYRINPHHDAVDSRIRDRAMADAARRAGRAGPGIRQMGEDTTSPRIVVVRTR